MRISVVAFSTNGCRTALRIKDGLQGHELTLACKTTSDTLGISNIDGKTIDWVVNASGYLMPSSSSEP